MKKSPKKKKDSRPLWILLAVVLLVIVGLEVYERMGSTKMPQNLTHINTDKVTRIALTNPRADQYLSLRNEASGWFITADKVQIPIDNSLMQHILSLFKTLPPVAEISTDKEAAEPYETTDETGWRITAYEGKKVLSDLYIGRTETVEGMPMTYVRKAGSPITYSVEGDFRKLLARHYFSAIFLEE